MPLIVGSHQYFAGTFSTLPPNDFFWGGGGDGVETLHFQNTQMHMYTGFHKGALLGLCEKFVKKKESSFLREASSILSYLSTNVWWG